MLWIKQGTHVIDHERFLAAGAHARDLWQWGMLYAGRHETDGEIPMVAVLTSAWGRGGRNNVSVASKLCLVGLWERTDSGYRICRWAEQGNQTKAQIAAERESARIRMASRRSGNVRANFDGSYTDVPTSTSLSLSSGSSLEIASSDLTSPPDWFVQSVGVIAMNTGVELPAPEAWLRYDGHRAGKGIAPNAKDAQYWLTTVMVPEARKVQREVSREKERDATFAKSREQAREPAESRPRDSRTTFRERDEWERSAGPPDPDTAARMKKLIGGVG